MGLTRVREMLRFAGPWAALHDHLQHGVYPPLPIAVMNMAMWAVEACADGRFEDVIGLVASRVDIKAIQIVEQMRLEGFIDAQEVH
jgi:hypothetical protein